MDTALCFQVYALSGVRCIDNKNQTRNTHLCWLLYGVCVCVCVRVILSIILLLFLAELYMVQNEFREISQNYDDWQTFCRIV